jgi:hypothetical protein
MRKQRNFGFELLWNEQLFRLQLGKTSVAWNTDPAILMYWVRLHRASGFDATLWVQGDPLAAVPLLAEGSYVNPCREVR